MKKVITNKKKIRKHNQKKQRSETNILFDKVVEELFKESDKRFQKKHIIKRCNKCCEECANFTPIGEGDHICIADDPVLILDDYCPTENYFYCNGSKFESWDDI